MFSARDIVVDNNTNEWYRVVKILDEEYMEVVISDKMSNTNPDKVKMSNCRLRVK